MRVIKLCAPVARSHPRPLAIGYAPSHIARREGERAGTPGGTFSHGGMRQARDERGANLEQRTAGAGPREPSRVDHERASQGRSGVPVSLTIALASAKCGQPPKRQTAHGA